MRKTKTFKKTLIGGLVCAVVASIMLFATACAGLPAVTIQPLEYSNFIAIGNGSIAVQYGPYVYFINGTRGTFDDANADQNRWGDVVQGGIYRARLLGDVTTRDNNTNLFNIEENPDNLNPSIVQDNEDQLFSFRMVEPLRDNDGNILPTFDTNITRPDNHPANRVDPRRINYNDPTLRFGPRLEIFTNYEENYDVFERVEFNERVDLVDVVPIAPKTVGTRARGGIWILNSHIFFASPSHTRDRYAVVQDERTEFIVMGLDGSNPRSIFTTPGDAADLPYVFHAVDANTVYLVASSRNEDNGNIDIITVRIETHANRAPRIRGAYRVTDMATQVFMPVRDTFDPNDNSVRLEDFVFYTRHADRNIHNISDHYSIGDIHNEGNVVFALAPGGAVGELERHTVFASNATMEIQNIVDNKLFYVRTIDGQRHVRFNNLHNLLYANSDRYAAQPNVNSLTALNGYVYRWGSLDEYTFTHFMTSISGQTAGEQNNAAYMLAFSQDGVFIVSYIDPQFSLVHRRMILHSPPEEFLFIRGSFMYYIEGASVYRVDLFATNATPELLSGELELVRSGGHANVALVAGHIAFFAAADRFTRNGTGYMFLSNLERPNDNPFFMGVRDERDIPSDTVLLNYLRGIEGEYINGDDGEDDFGF